MLRTANLMIAILAAGSAAQSALAAEPAAPANATWLPASLESERSSSEDVIQLRNGETIRGQMRNENVTLAAPYGRVTIPLRRCALISFEGTKANSEAVVTTNGNRLTGIVADRGIRYIAGGPEQVLRKEKIRRICLKKSADETALRAGKADLFVMDNGDLLTGKIVPAELKMIVDQGEVTILFAQTQRITFKDGGKTAIVQKQDGTTSRGLPQLEVVRLDLDFGASLNRVHANNLGTIVAGNGYEQIPALLAEAVPGLCFETGPEIITNTLGMKFKRIPPGTFVMGRVYMENTRKVTFTRPFYIGVYEVTQAEYKAIMGKNPSNFQGDKYESWAGPKLPLNYDDDKRPVECLSWYDAQEFCAKLSAKEGVRYRLPNEAEWEYACRAGTVTDYYWGDEYHHPEYYSWPPGILEKAGVTQAAQTAEVGTRKPNPWGLYDMGGNAQEYCEDSYNSYPAYDQIDPMAIATGGSITKRGGSLGATTGSGERAGYPPFKFGGGDGFRIIRCTE